MELAATQKLLARLFTDSQLRNRFYANPVKVGAEFGLSPETASTLAVVPEARVHDFAKSVRRRRLEAVTRLLPCSAKCLGPAFGEAFRDYVLQHALPAEAQAWFDAVSFGRFFRQWIRNRKGVPTWQQELLAYESERLGFEHGRDRFNCHLSLFPGHRTARRVSAGEIPTKVWPMPGLHVFWRWRRGGEMHERLL